MAQVVVVNSKGQKADVKELAGEVFNTSLNSHLVWEMVKSQRASLRSGNHSTLRRCEVRGGGKKPYKQKGTGRARQGSSRSPQFVGGGSVFGPKPRSYEYRLPRKERALALAGVLSWMAQEGRLMILGEISGQEFQKTREAVRFLQELGHSRVLIVVDREESSWAGAFVNLKDVKVVLSEHVGVYDILHRGCLVWTERAGKAIQRQLERTLGDEQ